MTNVEKTELANFRYSPAYEIVCNILEAECQRAENELLQTDPRQIELVRFNHIRAQSFRWLFERFQKTVLREIDPDQPPASIPESELIRRMMKNPQEFF